MILRQPLHFLSFYCLSRKEVLHRESNRSLCSLVREKKLLVKVHQRGLCRYARRFDLTCKENRLVRALLSQIVSIIVRESTVGAFLEAGDANGVPCAICTLLKFISNLELGTSIWARRIVTLFRCLSLWGFERCDKWVLGQSSSLGWRFFEKEVSLLAVQEPGCWCKDRVYRAGAILKYFELRNCCDADGTCGLSTCSTVTLFWTILCEGFTTSFYVYDYRSLGTYWQQIDCEPGSLSG
jgi:hypothetical protein